MKDLPFLLKKSGPLPPRLERFREYLEQKSFQASRRISGLLESLYIN